MGASGWAYFVPYQENIESALQQLREQVFKERKYYSPYSFGNEKAEAIAHYQDELARLDELDLEEDQIESIRYDYQKQLSLLINLPEPNTVQEAIEQLRLANWDSGTHSILDITTILGPSDFFSITPLSDTELTEMFGTTKPNLAQVDQEADQLMDLRGRWSGIYLIVYVDKEPSQIYFTGYSGD